jgi:hypothetical protein
MILSEFGGPETGEPPGNFLLVFPVFVSVFLQEQPLLIGGDKIIKDGDAAPGPEGGQRRSKQGQAQAKKKRSTVEGMPEAGEKD